MEERERIRRAHFINKKTIRWIAPLFKEREAFLEKVISGDRELRDDLRDVLMIEKAKKVKGKPVSARTYFAKRAKMGTTA